VVLEALLGADEELLVQRLFPLARRRVRELERAAVVFLPLYSLLDRRGSALLDALAELARRGRFGSDCRRASLAAALLYERTSGWS
jgi:hypothetical protein